MCIRNYRGMQNKLAYRFATIVSHKPYVGMCTHAEVSIYINKKRKQAWSI